MTLNKLLRDKGYYNGRTISWSKSAYREENPNNICVYNACIVSLKDGPSWFGDLDLTKDSSLLKDLALELDDTFYILSESEFMRNEKASIDIMITNAVWNTSQEIPVK